MQQVRRSQAPALLCCCGKARPCRNTQHSAHTGHRIAGQGAENPGGQSCNLHAQQDTTAAAPSNALLRAAQRKRVDTALVADAPGPGIWRSTAAACPGRSSGIHRCTAETAAALTHPQRRRQALRAIQYNLETHRSTIFDMGNLQPGPPQSAGGTDPAALCQTHSSLCHPTTGVCLQCNLGRAPMPGGASFLLGLGRRSASAGHRAGSKAKSSRVCKAHQGQQGTAGWPSSPAGALHRRGPAGGPPRAAAAPAPCPDQAAAAGRTPCNSPSHILVKDDDTAPAMPRLWKVASILRALLGSSMLVPRVQCVCV